MDLLGVAISLLFTLFGFILFTCQSMSRDTDLLDDMKLLKQRMEELEYKDP